MKVVAGTLPAQELTTFSYKILWHEIVVTVFAEAEFNVVMGDYILVRFTTRAASGHALLPR